LDRIRVTVKWGERQGKLDRIRVKVGEDRDSWTG
jgi:hypothetical protein